MPLSELRRYKDAVGDNTSFNLINLVRDDIVVKGSRADAPEGGGGGGCDPCKPPKEGEDDCFPLEDEDEDRFARKDGIICTGKSLRYFE